MKYERGFTLIELLVVIAIIGILSAIIAPNAFKAIEKSKCTQAISDAKAIKTAALLYYSDTGIWPHGDGAHDDIDNYTDPNPFLEDDGVEGWDGPYLENPGQNPFNKRPRDSAEYGYQWEGTWRPASPAANTSPIDFDGDGTNDPCVEMGFMDLSSQRQQTVMEEIDKKLDDGDLDTGNYRHGGGNDAWGYYRVTWE